MRKFVFIGSISNSNMAASSGKKMHKSTGSIILCVFLLSSIVPYCQTFSLPTQKLTLSIPHTARKGFTVLKTDLKQTCIEIDHIQRSVSNRRPSNPFSVQNDGSLVIQAPAHNFLGDLFVIRSKKSKSCQRTSTVSQTSPVYVEIVYSNKTLHFVRQDYTGLIHEHAPVGTKVNGIQHLYACSALRCSNNLEYRIVGSNGFYLETISNDRHIQVEIYTKSVLQSSSYNFMIVAQNADGLQGHTSIEVKVTPVSYPVSVLADENLYFSPRAIHRHKRASQETLTTRSVDETKTGFLFSVKDPNNDWKYTLASSTYQNAFAVSETGDVSVAPGFELDYETLTTDGISNPVQLVINVLEKSDYTLVKELIQPVTINDINDELPVFTNKPTPFLAAVSLAAPPNTLVYTLTAADPDAGANLTLALSPATNSQVANFFLARIQGTTAEIRRIGNQQFTENQEFRMNFIATDNAAPDGTTQRTNAEVQILAGARKPQFMEKTYLIEFEEKNNMDQVIATVEVYSFQQNPVTFTVLDENLQISTVFGTQTVTNPTGPIKGCHIIVKKIIDYETPPRTFSVKIIAQEDNTALFSDQDATISVTDNNEFEPRFNASTYKAENTREVIAVGSALLTVAATDADFNTKLTFSVDNDHFRVEANDPSGTQMPQTATIYVNKKLDYDRISPKNYDFHVRATDDGEISKTGEATVRIFMTNQNDEPPVFPDPMTADLRFNAETDQQVTIIQATDADQGDKVSYAIVSSNSRFGIETNTGRITLKQSIPANTESYELVIQATDDGGCCDGDSTRHTSTGTLTINILYDNLARPEFTDCLTYQPEVSEEQADAFVIRVTATDTDIGSNGRVTYSIRESNSKFRISSTTGELYTAENIDREALGVSKTVPVNVIATDGGNLQGTCSLLVKIIDVNDNAPIFVTQTYDFPVEDTSAPDSVAAFVEATDADSGLNGEVQYSFTADGNPGGYFRFDNPSFTGQIKVNKTLQQDATITLTVKATDRGIPSLSSIVTVIMRVTSDPTQLPPQWSSSGYSVTVNESISSSNTILTFSAQSRVENNVKLVFRVVDQKSIFMTDNIISTETLQQGNLRLKPGKSLDFETTESYSLTLRASDVRNIYSDQRVTITVTDTNDNVPVFVGTNPETGFLDLSLLEGNYTNSRKEVGRIRAIDNDKNAPNNQIVGYAIVETDSLFTIDPITGMLYTRHEFDRENPNYIFAITVEAIDGAPSAFPVFAGRPNTGTVNIKITIEDINDNPPSFPQQSYTFEAPEDLLIGDRLPNNVKVSATDPDSAAVLTYSVSPLPSSNLPPPFSIQTQTGLLTVAGALDYDKGPAFQRYEFIVNVFDSIHSSSTTVTINVKNVNDHSPVVGNYQFNDFVEEDASVIGPIATVNASDIDGDIDGDGVVRFWYELKFTDDKDRQYFSINQQSGVLSIVKPLDRDQPDGNAEFIFTVEVADEDPNNPSKTPRYGFGEVVVRPIDINDNAPKFPEEARQMTVMENQNPGTLVGRVEVIDYDAGINAEFDLTITGQLPNQVFTLDVLDIETIAILDRETIDTYFVTVQAVDKGHGRNTGTGTLTICVGDQTYSVYLSEHQLSVCPNVTAPANGYVSTAKKNLAVYACIRGFEIIGSKTLVCNLNGSWNNLPPICKIKDCGHPVQLGNGSVDTSKGTTFGSIVTFSCNTGYDLRGYRHAICQANSSWNISSPICNIKDCGYPSKLDNGSVDTSKGTTFGSIVTFSCNNGYKLIGERHAICQANGSWNITSPRCNIKDCGNPNPTANGKYSLDARQLTVYNHTATYQCNAGYETADVTLTTCNSSGKWSSPPPKCNDIDECARLTARCHRRAQCTNTNGSYRCKCNDGFVDISKNGQVGIDCRAIQNAGKPEICFNCDDMSSPEYCDIVARCQKNQVCYTESYQSVYGKVFRSGCMDEHKCHKEENSTSSAVCVECCSTDMCNNRGCGNTDFPTREQRGPMCFDCHHTGDINSCSKVTMCSSDQVCSIGIYQWGDSFHYKLGCTHHLCNPVFRHMLRSVPSCHSCCNDDYCNRNCSVSNSVPGEIFVG